MTAKTKVILRYPYIAFKLHRTKKVAKKIRKAGEENDRYPAQWRNDYILKFVKKLTKILKVEVEVIGRENLPKAPAILAPNHASLFDPALIMIALEDTRPGSDYINTQSVFIAKKELSKNRRAKGLANVMNTYYIDRKNPRASLKNMEDFAQHAKDTKKMAVIFPEGTRSKDGEVKEFKSGAFKMAKRTFIPVVPLTINNSYSISNLSRKKTLKVQVIFGKTIKPMSFISSDNKSLANRVQKEVLKTWVKPEGTRSEKGAKLAK